MTQSPRNSGLLKGRGPGRPYALQANLKRKVRTGRLPVWVAVTNPLMKNIELRKLLKVTPKPRLSDKEIDWIVTHDLGLYNPLCGELRREQIQRLFDVLPPRCKYPNLKEP